MMLEEKRILQLMTPEQRILAAATLYDAARELKEAALREFHPDWTDGQILEAVQKSFSHARS
jgi:hypothetical protein